MAVIKANGYGHGLVEVGRAAVSELKRRGIGYILIFDSDLGAPEIQRAQDSWGMREAGSYRQAHLYKLL